ncbi:MAG: hypothetical protein IKE23_07360 [Exiguobacterium sp.]|nr:hypothetical protein [Exiguobacterium sp.]
MSKLIVEMEMPRFCAECPMCDNVYYGDDVRKSFCVVFDERKEILTEDRPSWCPIKGVLPDEHGDLIDRDSLMIELMDRGIEGVQTDDLAEFQQIVMDAKAVIAAERKDNEQQSQRQGL